MKTIKPILIIFSAVVIALYAGWRLHERFYTDDTPPVLSCDADTVEVSVRDSAALLRGMTASDDRDGDISDRVKVLGISQLTGPDTAKVTYVVFDNADNMATCARTVRYTDYEEPRFSLSAPLIYSAGGTVTLADRLTAEDVIDGDISAAIRVTSLSLLTSAEGSYAMTVQVTNSMGDTAILPLTVIVDNGSFLRPSIELTDYLVYLSTGDSFNAWDYYAGIHTSPRDAKTPTREGVTMSSTVNTEEAGTYEASFFYTNQYGETCQTILTVVVR